MEPSVTVPQRFDNRSTTWATEKQGRRACCRIFWVWSLTYLAAAAVWGRDGDGDTSHGQKGEGNGLELHDVFWCIKALERRSEDSSSIEVSIGALVICVLLRGNINLILGISPKFYSRCESQHRASFTWQSVCRNTRRHNGVAFKDHTRTCLIQGLQVGIQQHRQACRLPLAPQGVAIRLLVPTRRCGGTAH